jgi:HAD superfamily hydrolase (TIGR01459 family)
MMSPLHRLTCIRDLASRHDTFMVDQWGVLHDGQSVYPGVVDCLARLQDAGKQVILLSNSGKPAAANLPRLVQFGILPTHYTHLVTSGDLARLMLERREFPFTEEVGQRYLFLGSDDNQSLMDGLPLEPVDSVAAADFILLSGVRDDRDGLFYHTLLNQALAAGRPLICINPDRVRFSAGRFSFSAGAVAEAYRAMGGSVHFIGKPHPAIYAHCRSLLPDLQPARTLAVGDSLYHDIGGGARFGAATAWVMGGIHQTFIRYVGDDVCTEPDWVLKRFSWDE